MGFDIESLDRLQPNMVPVFNDEQEVSHIKLVGLDVPFWDMFVFIIKWTIASVPALFVIAGVFGLVLGGLA